MATGKERRAEARDLLALRSAQLQFAQQAGRAVTAPARAVAGGGGGLAVLIVGVVFVGWVFATGKAPRVMEILRGKALPPPPGSAPEPAAGNPPTAPYGGSRGDEPAAGVPPTAPKGGSRPTNRPVDPTKDRGYDLTLPPGTSPSCMACIKAFRKRFPSLTVVDAYSRCLMDGKCPNIVGGGAYVR